MNQALDVVAAAFVYPSAAAIAAAGALYPGRPDCKGLALCLRGVDAIAAWAKAATAVRCPLGTCKGVLPGFLQRVAVEVARFFPVVRACVRVCVCVLLHGRVSAGVMCVNVRGIVCACVRACSCSCVVFCARLTCRHFPRICVQMPVLGSVGDVAAPVTWTHSGVSAAKEAALWFGGRAADVHLEATPAISRRCGRVLLSGTVYGGCR